MSHLKTKMKKTIGYAGLAALVLAAGVRLRATEDVTLFRVFLNDGTAVVSYGEYARVGTYSPLSANCTGLWGQAGAAWTSDVID